MRLEHVNIVVKDMAETLAFYQAIFPTWKIRGQNKEAYFGSRSHWVHFGDDYNYLAFHQVLQDVPNSSIIKTKLDLGFSHLAFEVDDLQQVTERLSVAGYQPRSNGNPTEYRKNLYYSDPNGIDVEFVQYLTDQPELRNDY